MGQVWVDRVFNNDLLRETILSHVIREEINRGSSRPNLRSIRLVQKGWLEDACRLLHKWRKPLYKIKLSKDQSNNDQRHCHKLLDQFTRTVTGEFRLEPIIPPFSVQIFPDFFHEENHQSLSDFFERCAEGLVELSMTIPESGGTMTFIFPNHVLKFPRLQCLSFHFSDCPSWRYDELLSNEKSVYFLQAILNGTEELKRLSFIPSNKMRKSLRGVDYLCLPQTITHMNVRHIGRASQQHILLRSDLPNLTELTIQFASTPYPDGFIYKVLDRFKSTLCSFLAAGYHQTRFPRRPTFIRFPLMDRLQTCKFLTAFAELEPEHPPLPELLPNLNELGLDIHTEEMFLKWTSHTVFPGVTKLRVSLLKTDSSGVNVHSLFSFKLETVQLLQNSFPSLRSLNLSVSCTETSGIPHLFLNMTQLTELTLVVYNCPHRLNANLWDARLAGVPVGMVAGLRMNPGIWPNFQLNDDGFPSIRRLTELKSLWIYDKMPEGDLHQQQPLISDLSFYFAFLKMPSLKELHLGGRFRPSPEMAGAWMADNRSLFQHAY